MYRPLANNDSLYVRVHRALHIETFCFSLWGDVFLANILSHPYCRSSNGDNRRLVQGVLLAYVVESLLAALLHLVDSTSEDGRRQLPAYRVNN